MLSRLQNALIAGMASLAATAATATDTDESPKVSYNRQSSESGWSASVAGQDREPAVEPGESELTLRVYDGGRRFGPVYNRKGEFLAVDVTSEIETCPDGNTIIKALRIGSWRYRLDYKCEDFRRGTQITVTRPDGSTIIEQDAAAPTTSAESRVIRCDPASWTCRTVTE
ncbi:MAG: hypothetical protein QNJ73_03855 [Gammaproteobacteria bacterium]|nr:hypothetical protein [Gammaproteobacteria bacterium]